MKKTIGLVAAAGIAAATVLASAPAQAATVNIGVAPSPNGYVMEGVPSQITVSGVASANVQVKKGGGWVNVGKVTKVTKSVPYTFNDSGIHEIRVGKKMVRVTVYRTVNHSYGRGTAATFAGAVLPEASMYPIGTISASDGPNEPIKVKTLSIPADRGCVLVSVGVRDSGTLNAKYPFTGQVKVASGAAPFETPVTSDPNGIVAKNIPVSGLTVIEFYGRGSKVVGGFEAVCAN